MQGWDRSMKQWSAQVCGRNLAKCPGPSLVLLQKQLVGPAVGTELFKLEKLGHTTDTIPRMLPNCPGGGGIWTIALDHGNGLFYISWLEYHSYPETQAILFIEMHLWIQQSCLSMGYVRDNDTQPEKVRNVGRCREGLKTEVLVRLGRPVYVEQFWLTLAVLAWASFFLDASIYAW